MDEHHHDVRSIGGGLRGVTPTQRPEAAAARIPIPERRERARLLAEVRDGLARRQRELPGRLLRDADNPAAALVAALDARRAEAVERPLVDAAIARLARDARGARLHRSLGNAIGAHTTIPALRALRELRAAMAPSDHLLLGVDVRDGARIERAMRNERAVRAEYHRHALTVLRRDLDAEIDVDAFDYEARFDAEARRADLVLVAARACRIALPDGPPIEIRRHETIRTAVHATFDAPRLSAMLSGVGLVIDAWLGGDGHAVVVASVAR